MSDATPAPLVEMRGIVKRFPGVVANDGVDLTLLPGEVHALLGENGAGKTTLMNVLYGLYRPDAGEILRRGRPARLGSPRDAIRLGIGMVHQHFMLVPTLTVAENVVLGTVAGRRLVLDLRAAGKQIAALGERYGLPVNPQAEVWQLSVGEQQRVEILKALYRGAEVLILDEPTSVLTPQEVEALVRVLRRMAEEGKAVVFISHKLREVMAISQRVTVLRAGRVEASLPAAEASEQRLALLMVGRHVDRVGRREPQAPGAAALQVRDLEALGDNGLPALRGVSFEIRQGECVGLAGVSGNGQRELAEVIAGLRRARAGSVRIGGRETTRLSPEAIRAAGLAYVPEERKRVGAIGEFTLEENAILATHRRGFTRHGLLDRGAIRRHALELIAGYDVRTPGPQVAARTLSGGNLQKLILGRELAGRPKVLVAAQPTRGLDVGATEYVHRQLLEARRRATGLLLISEDLDEVIGLSDRILVIYEGRIVGEVPGERADREQLGLWMGGAGVGRAAAAD